MNILITAGGTIEKIDDVRTINNMSTGKLGTVICNNLTKYRILSKESQENSNVFNNIIRVLDVNDKIFYVHSKTALKPNKSNLIELFEVTDTKSLESTINTILNNNKIDLVIHSMAVSDYTVESVSTAKNLEKSFNWGSKLETLSEKKIPSDNDEIYIKMVKTPKIINMFKEHDENIFLFGFKLLSDVSEKELREASLKQIKNSGSDVVIANDLKDIKSGNHIAHYYVKKHMDYYRKYKENSYEKTTSGKNEIANIINNRILVMKSNFLNVETIFQNFYYDGFIDGFCLYNNVLYYITYSNDDDIYGDRIYSMYKLTDNETKEFYKFKDLQDKYIGCSDYCPEEEKILLNKKYKNDRIEFDFGKDDDRKKYNKLCKIKDFEDFIFSIPNDNKIFGLTYGPYPYD